MTSYSAVLRFGKCLFRVGSKRAELVEQVESVFAAANTTADTSHSDQHILIEELDDYEQKVDTTDDSLPQDDLIISELIKRISFKHDGCLWLSAAVLLTPTGKLVLVAGPSFSGKTTLALAMSLSHGWKLLSEDITIIDPETIELVPTPSPSGIREKTRDLLSKLCSLPRSGFQLNEKGEWFMESRLYYLDSLPAVFSTAIVLMPIDRNMSDPMSAQPLSSPEFIRRILPLSNALLLSGAVDSLHATVLEARCLAVDGGSLEERVRLLGELHKQPPD